MNILSFKNNKNNTGFTLIETLVAITILLVAISGPLTLATRSFLNAFVARDQLTASYLAEDAIEYVRYIRDSNFIDSGAGWIDGLNSCIPGPCQIDTGTGTGNISACTNAKCSPLLYNPSTGFYGYDKGDESVFIRTVTLSGGLRIDDKYVEYVIESKVEWQTRSLQRSFTTKEHIYNWFGS